jgi:hypothetical protein
VTQVLAKAFSLKDTTSASIVQSAPIILLNGLTLEEAAVLKMVMQSVVSAGAMLEFTTADLMELPKVDWPRRPAVFKRDVADYLADAQFTVPCPECHHAHRLIDLLVCRLTSEGTSVHHAPRTAGASREFRGAAMPEITPFSNAALAPMPSAASGGGGGDTLSRLDELFPDDSGALTGAMVPNDDAISSILDRLLPDDDRLGQTTGTTGMQPALSGTSGSGFSVFLAKIADEGRRAKAVPIIAELAKISAADADVLSKKPIIPVLRGSTRDEAESAKQRFAKIGILARVKGGE